MVNRTIKKIVHPTIDSCCSALESFLVKTPFVSLCSESSKRRYLFGLLSLIKQIISQIKMKICNNDQFRYFISVFSCDRKHEWHANCNKSGRVVQFKGGIMLQRRLYCSFKWTYVVLSRILRYLQQLVYTVLIRPKIRPTHVSAVTQRHVKNHLFMTNLATGFAAKGLLNLLTSSPLATGLAH